MAEIGLHDQAPRYRAKEVKTYHAKSREKTNLLVEDETHQYLPLFSKSAVHRESDGDYIDYTVLMEHEFQVLEDLKDTGVTPEPLMIKIDEGTDGERRSHMLTSAVEGQSIEYIEHTEESRANFGPVIESALASQQKIHDKGYLMRDVNLGSFVYTDYMDPETECSVVDFEHAYKVDELGSTVQEQEDFLSRNKGYDFGLERAFAQGKTLTPDQAFAADRAFAIAKFLDSYIGYSRSVDSLSAEDQKRYDEQYRELIGPIKDMVLSELRAKYDRDQASGVIRADEIFEEFLGYEYRPALDNMIGAAMLNITLPTLLKESGCEVSDETVDFLCRAVDPDIDKRPTRYEAPAKQTEADKIDAVKDRLSELMQNA